MDPTAVGELGLLARLRGRLLVNSVRAFRRQSALKVVVVSAAGIIFWTGIFAAALSGFRFMKVFLGDPELLVERLLSLFFLLLGTMLAFSNAIISFGSLFRSEETDFLLACPLGAESIFAYRLIESLTFSSWAFLVLGFPLMLAYGLSVGAPWYFPLAILGYFAPFVVIPAAMGAAAALLLAAFLPDRVKRVLGLSVVAGLAVGTSLVVWIHGAVQSGTPFTEVWLQRVLGRMNFARNLFLPSYWVAQGLMQGARGRLLDAGYYWLVLASNAALGLAACWELARWRLRVGWSRSRSHTGMRRRAAGGWALARWAPAMRLLVAKDWRLFVRDPVQWSQCAILFGLMGFYVLNLRAFSYHLAHPLWRNLTALLNLAATSLVLATVTTRFIFPLLSLEGRRFWMLGLVPVSRRAILWAKFLFSFLAALVVTVPLVVLSDYMLNLSAATLGHHAVATVSICFGVSGLSVGLGAVYPDWHEQNPSKIVSGFGGTLNLLLSIGFVLLVVAITAWPYAREPVLLGVAGPRIGYAMLGAGGVGLAAGLLPMHLGRRALARLEF